MKVIYSKEAVADYCNAFEYIAKDNLVAAKKLVIKFDNCINLLKTNPYLGHPGRKEGTRELFIINTKYFIVYRIKNDNLIEILTFLHTSRNY